MKSLIKLRLLSIVAVMLMITTVSIVSAQSYRFTRENAIIGPNKSMVALANALALQGETDSLAMMIMAKKVIVLEPVAKVVVIEVDRDAGLVKVSPVGRSDLWFWIAEIMLFD
jgi:hypothetical protein